LVLNNYIKECQDIASLFDAVFRLEFDKVSFLIKSGVNINVTDGDGWTPLMRACSSRRNNTRPELIKMIYFLCDNGANKKYTTPDGKTAKSVIQTSTTYPLERQQALGIDHYTSSPEYIAMMDEKHHNEVCTILDA
jgi:hypothetical protein